MSLSSKSIRRLTFGGLFTMAALLSACGGDGGRNADTVEPLPLSDVHPRAFSERFLVENPNAALRPEHLAILTLEPAAPEAAGIDTGTADGVDEVFYHFQDETELTLQIEAEARHIGRLLLVDLQGMLWVEAELDGSPATVTLPAGEYVLEVHHARRGDSSAATGPVFLRPAVAPAASQADGSGAGIQNQNVATILAGQNCVSCDFTGAVLHGSGGLLVLDGLDLHGSTFTSVYMLGVSLRGANLDATSWWAGSCDECVVNFPLITEVDFTGASMMQASFVSAQLAGVQFRGASMNGVDFCRFCSFTGMAPSACLTNSTSTDCNFSAPFPDQGCDFSTDTAGTATNMSGSNLTMLTVAPCTNFAGATLSNAVFEGNTFQSANFAGARLDNAAMQAMFPDATFTNAVLDGADLSSASAGGADFSGASLKATSMKDAKFENARMMNAVLDGADLTQADGSGSDFSGASLVSVTMKDGMFTGAKLFEADLHMATLDGAVLVGANLDFANLRGASMVGAMLGVADAQSAQRASLVGAYMPDVDLTDADLRNANLTSAHIYGDQSLSKLVRVMLDGATMVGAICSGASFNQASLSRTQLNEAQLVSTTFNDAVLTGAIFDSAYLQGADFSSAMTTNGVSLNNAAIATMPGAWTYMDQDGAPVTFEYEATNLGALASDPTVICPDGMNGPCTGDRLTPVMNGPFPPIPPCVPTPPQFDNCAAPTPPPG